MRQPLSDPERKYYMDKSNLAEIRKALRKNDPPVDWIYAFYVTPDNECNAGQRAVMAIIPQISLVR